MSEEVLKLHKKFLDKSSFSSPEEAFDLFGIPGYFDTGLPNFDMHLMHNKERTAYGFPRGRVCELAGNNSTFKTSITLLVAARALARDGIVYINTSEMDFDKDYLDWFIDQEGIDEDIDELPVGINYTPTVADMFEKTQEIVDYYNTIAKKLEKKGKKPLKHLPPILIVQDSIASMLSQNEYDSIEDDFDNNAKMATKASDLHKFFKFFITDFSRLGICFLFTNHLRSNIGGYGHLTAHNKPIEFYASLRLRLKKKNNSSILDNARKTGDMGKTLRENKISFKAGTIIEGQVRKTRERIVGDGKFHLKYYWNHGFDYFDSTIDALHRSRVAPEYAGTYSVDVNEDHPLSEINGEYEYNELKSIFRDDPELLLKAGKAALKEGHAVLEDRR